MSGGPIKSERDAWKPPRVSNGSSKDAVHGLRLTVPPTTACGRRSGTSSALLSDVTCSDCLAAREADRGQGATA